MHKTMPACCPEDPNVHCCVVTDRYEWRNPGTGCEVPCCPNCDATVCCVGLAFVVTLIGLLISFTTFDEDLLHVYTCNTSTEFAEAAYLHNRNHVENIAAAAALPLTSSGLRHVSPCHDERPLTGSPSGVVCVDGLLEADVMLANLARWRVFRSSLYFLAAGGSFVTLLAASIIDDKRGGCARRRHNGLWFYGTPLYYAFRMAWAAASVPTLLWIAGEMHQYWWIIDAYTQRTTGPLHDFWAAFEDRFGWKIVCLGVFLCWPIVHLLLEAVIAVVGFVPWVVWVDKFDPRMAAPGPYIDPAKPHDEHSACIRAHLFFAEWRQLARFGFSEGQWELLLSEPRRAGLAEPEDTDRSRQTAIPMA
jgi:hypothetical protein